MPHIALLAFRFQSSLSWAPETSPIVEATTPRGGDSSDQVGGPTLVARRGGGGERESTVRPPSDEGEEEFGTERLKEVCLLFVD